MLGLTLVIALGASQTSIAQDEQDCGRTRCVRARGRAAGPGATSLPPPAIQFAPTSGEGMTAECGNSLNPNSIGTVGSTSFNRASSGTCIAGNTIAIANGSMSTCSSNVARVMRGGDGSGALGLLQEEARTNSALRSEELSNAAWSVANSGSSDPVVTADQGVAPDGTTTAERVQFGACASVTNISILFQTGLGGAGTYAGSVFCKGFSSSQTISVCAFDDGANAGTCIQVVCSTTAWTRASQARSVAVTTGGLVLGCVNALNYTGAASTGAADVLLWGADFEAGAFSTSYVKTTSAAVTRAADGASIGSLPAALLNASGSVAATVLPLSATVGGIAQFSAAQRPLYLSGGKGTMYDSSTVLQTSAGTITPGPTRFYSFWSGASMTVAVPTESLTATGAFNGVMQNGSTTLEIGNGTSGAAQLNGVLKQFCADPSPTRCR